MKLTRIGMLVTAGAVLVAATGCAATEPNVPAAEGEPNFGNCEIQADTANFELDPLDAGVLTIAAPLPTPGYYDGNTPDTIEGGYAYCLAAEIAFRGGLTSMKLNNASFESIVQANMSAYDFTIYDVSITAERAKVIDFTDPYRTADMAVMVAPGSDWNEGNLADARIGVLTSSTAEALVDNTIKPTQEVRRFATNDDLTNSFAAGQIDAIIHDIGWALIYQTNSEGKGEVVARFPGDELGIVLPKDSPNTSIVNDILKEMQADGAIAEIEKNWLAPLYGGVDPNSVPFWKAG